MVLAEADALAAQDGRAQEAGTLYKKVGFGLGLWVCGWVCGGGYVTIFTLLSKGWVDGWPRSQPTQNGIQHHQQTLIKRCTRI